MTLNNAPFQTDSPSFRAVLTKTTAAALLSLTALAISTTGIQASAITETEETDSREPASKLLSEWDTKITKARQAFTPVIQALKLLADQDFRQNVVIQQGDNFQQYETEKVTLAWNKQKVVVEFLKELYGAHTKLIPDYYHHLQLLFQSQENLQREQEVSRDFRSTLQKAQEKIETLQQKVEVAQQEAINALSAHHSEGLLEGHDLEEGQPLLKSETLHPIDASLPTPWKTRTVIMLSTGCTAIGMGVGALITWLLLSE